MTTLPPLPDEETQRLLQFLYVCPVGLISFHDDGTIERINPAAVNLLAAVVDLLDHRSAFTMLRQPWPELQDIVREGAGRVGILVDSHRVRSHAERREQWLSLSVVRVAADSNMLTVSDITSSVLAEQQADRRHTFLLAVSDTLRDLGDPVAIGQTFVTMLGRELGVDRVHHTRLTDSGDHLVVANAFTSPGHDGPTPGTRVMAYQPTLDLLIDGTMLAIDDVATDARLDAESRDRILTVGGRSLLVASRFVDGRVARLLSVADDEPRAWSHHELTLVEEVADRLWSAEEQATADRNSEAQLASIIDTAADSIIVIDNNGVIRLANRATTATFGYPVEDLLGRNVTVLMGTVDGASHAGYLERYEPDGRPSAMAAREVEGRRADGSAVPLELAVTEWFDSHGERFFTGILRDITQRKEQIEVLARASKLEIAGQLAGGVAHDLNNLLTVIGGNLELAEEQVDQPRTRTLLNRALDAVRRGVTFNSRLLTLVHDRPRNVQPLALADHLQEAASMAQHLLGPDVSLELHVDPQLWPVSVDPGELDSAILNLAGNGCDAIVGGGTLTITARNVTLRAADVPTPGSVPGDYVVLAVIDTGIGMTSDVVKRATDPFFTTKPAGHGTGLGLASVAGFVHTSGGFLVIDSAPGRGTAVALYLPRGGEWTSSTERPDDAVVAGGGRRILVVDDDDLVRETTAGTVEALGYDVATAGDGAEAISHLQRDPGIELVLTDVVMPGIDGRQLAAWIGAHRPDVRVVLCSGYDTGPDDDTGVRWPYLAKPYSRRELGETLASALESER